MWEAVLLKSFGQLAAAAVASLARVAACQPLDAAPLATTPACCTAASHEATGAGRLPATSVCLAQVNVVIDDFLMTAVN